MRTRTRRVTSSLGAIAAASALAVGAAAPAHAATETGWTGPSFVNGVSYLHNSSVSTDWGLFATTNIWPAFGMAFQPNQVGAMARLFKSGVLCDANGYWYNGAPSTFFTVSTSNPDCGSGWYNSHGFVRMANGSGGWTTATTFPTNPVEFTEFGLRSDSIDDEHFEEVAVESGVNANGQTFGSGEGVEESDQLPELVAAYGSNGTFGYVRAVDLVSAEASEAAVEDLPTSEIDGVSVKKALPRLINVYAEDGVTVVGEFEVQR